MATFLVWLLASIVWTVVIAIVRAALGDEGSDLLDIAKDTAGEL